MLNFVDKTVSVGIINRCFGEIDDEDQFIPIERDLDKSEMAFQTGKFKSKTQARKNGWLGPVPVGLHQWRIGKTTFWSFIPPDGSPWEDFTDEEKQGFFYTRFGYISS